LEHEFSFEEFVSNFKDFVRNQNLSDISYSVQDQLFAAHKAIIACRCPVIFFLSFFLPFHSTYSIL